MTKVEFEYPREKWGEGPWQDEPDRVEFEHAGFPCLIVRAPIGGLCGYVAVPPGHPWHGDRDPKDARVHGGVTFASSCTDHICHVPKPGEPDDVWWIGFDCNHGCDYSPVLYSELMGPRGEMRRMVLAEMAADYKTIEYVRAECAQLAEQARDLDRLKRGDW